MWHRCLAFWNDGVDHGQRGLRVKTRRQYGVQFTSRYGPFQCAQLTFSSVKYLWVAKKQNKTKDTMKETSGYYWVWTKHPVATKQQNNCEVGRCKSEWAVRRTAGAKKFSTREKQKTKTKQKQKNLHRGWAAVSHYPVFSGGYGPDQPIKPTD